LFIVLTYLKKETLLDMFIHCLEGTGAIRLYENGFHVFQMAYYRK